MKTMIMLLALTAISGPSIAGAQGRGVAVRSGFVVRPGFSHSVFSPRPFAVVRPGFSRGVISRGAFFSYPYGYSYSYPYSYSLYPYAGYPSHPGYLTPHEIYSARSYSTSPPPPPSDAYDRGYDEGYAQGYEQAQKEHDKDRYEEGKQRGYQEGYEAGKSGQNP